MPDNKKPNREGELLARLTDRANPRTPLHFKLLDHQEARRAPFIKGNARSVFHRTEGYTCGIAAAPPKPISKMFGDGNE